MRGGIHVLLYVCIMLFYEYRQRQRVMAPVCKDRRVSCVCLSMAKAMRAVYSHHCIVSKTATPMRGGIHVLLYVCIMRFYGYHTDGGGTSVVIMMVCTGRIMATP